jgi:hypothetical protein
MRDAEKEGPKRLKQPRLTGKRYLNHKLDVRITLSNSLKVAQRCFKRTEP